jgi:hypothetical protein
MGRSQRHLIQEHNTTSAGEVHAQGVVATSVAVQVNPSELNVLEAALETEPRAGELTVPAGPQGGPLQGSSMSGAIPESVQPGPEPEPPPDPEPGSEPTLTSLDPATAVLGDPDLTLRCIGTNFTETSVIHFSDHDEPTTFVSDTEVTTGVKPSLGWGAVSLPVTIRQGSFETGPLDFTFTEAAPEAGRGGQRMFPLGPFNIVRIDDDVDGLSLELVEGDVRVGDAIVIEASGSSSVNGSYTVLSVADGVIVFDSDFALTTPIEGKGRLTVTGGA